jgi:sialidase-1
MAVQLPGGRVQLNIRSESGALRRAIAHSPDGVTQWSTPAFHPTLREPVCMASLLIHPRGTLFFTNPDHLDANASSKPGRNSQRRNLTLQRSTDLGQTWQVLEVIDPGLSAYSDMTLTRQGELLVLYEKGGLNGNQYFTRSLRLARVPAQLLVP